MLKLKIQDLYTGVTLTEMEPLLDLSEEPIEVRWENTKAEVLLLQRCKGRDVTLIVPNFIAMERAASTLGLTLIMDRTLASNGIDSLNNPDGMWRDHATQTGPNLSRSMLIGTLAKNLRRGGDFQPLRKVLVESLLDNISPIETDVLMGLRIRGARG